MIDDYTTIRFTCYVVNHKQSERCPFRGNIAGKQVYGGEKTGTGVIKPEKKHPKHWMLLAFLTRLYGLWIKYLKLVANIKPNFISPAVIYVKFPEPEKKSMGANTDRPY